MNLYDMRKQAKLTQVDVSKRLNVSQGTMSNWESGKNPPLKKYRKQLAAIYGVTLDELSEAISGSLKESKWRQ